MPDGLERFNDVITVIREERFGCMPGKLRTVDRGDHVEMAFEITTKYRKYPNHLMEALLQRFPSIGKIEVKR
ncbi:MAG: hypothetical protein RBU21_18110 [FCB group bacterium]|jgi:hypothetical protein|nr:hypothetical protein [FCB group bacterium]